MTGTSFAHVFGSKVVYNYTKENRKLLVTPKARSGGTLVLSIFDKEFSKDVVGKGT